MKVAGVILAGGQARRMGGGDKGLLDLGGVSLLARVTRRLAPQVEVMCLNANGDAARFDAFGLDVVADPIEGFAGPLAGVLAGMRWAEAQGADHVVSVAADTPFFPADLVERLQTGAAGTSPVLAAVREAGRVRRQPTFGFWPVALADDLEAALGDGVRKVVQWTERHDGREVVFGSSDAFFNVNTPEDLARAELML
ncbi:molybdenum cofactor guanylyltransferase MobA [Vannielia litorea]|uniref:molybdenum cofactor guanylyltransferase MobA n=1 Tax=Vannielia litorea TaxID=1217970 RepID=UPI001C9576B8|nr:molybdenum cofactor guanylyltransferase MobA [Vannielia litorea]MBY6049581.1 molybdenum cofactor guanylyltransferase MobA [Vannielia litorea]MBY6076995.1 molybdenum cofactor guanylyltransferase MobA [Vannielia litorea]